jgi:hypothetical protein
MTLDQFLHDKSIARRLKLSEMSDYKPYRIKREGDSSSFYGSMGMPMFYMMGDSLRNGSGFLMAFLVDVVWTKGEIVSLAGADALVTYRLDLSYEHVDRSIHREQIDRSPQRQTVTFRLDLVKASTITSLEPIEELDAARMKEVFKAANTQEEGAPQEASNEEEDMVGKAKQIAVGMQLYVTDYDDQIPYVQASSSLKDLILPYTKNIAIWETHNPNGSRMLMNMSLAGALMSQIPSPSATPIVFEDRGWPDGRRAVAFADAHSALLTEAEWQRLQPMLHLKLKRVGKPLPVRAGRSGY